MRRKHNYLPLIMEMLKTLASEGTLVQAVERQIEKQRVKGNAAKKPSAK